MYYPKICIEKLKPTRTLIKNEIIIQKEKIGRAMFYQDKDSIKNHTIIGEVKSSARKNLYEQRVVCEDGF